MSYGPWDLVRQHDRGGCSRDGVNVKVEYLNVNMNTYFFKNMNLSAKKLCVQHSQTSEVKLDSFLEAIQVLKN